MTPDRPPAVYPTLVFSSLEATEGWTHAVRWMGGVSLLRPQDRGWCYDSPVDWREDLMKRFVEGVDRGSSRGKPAGLSSRGSAEALYLRLSQPGSLEPAAGAWAVHLGLRFRIARPGEYSHRPDQHPAGHRRKARPWRPDPNSTQLRCTSPIGAPQHLKFLPFSSVHQPVGPDGPTGGTSCPTAVALAANRRASAASTILIEDEDVMVVSPCLGTKSGAQCPDPTAIFPKYVLKLFANC